MRIGMRIGQNHQEEVSLPSLWHVYVSSTCVVVYNDCKSLQIAITICYELLNVQDICVN